MIKKAIIFDFDDTLVKTNAKTHVYRNGKLIRSLSPQEYYRYNKHKDDIFDLSEFDNPKDLNNTAIPYLMWDLFIKSLKSKDIDVYILTARHKSAKKHIYNLLKFNNLNLSINNIFTIGDNNGDVSIPVEKRKILQKLSKKYSSIDFYDDNKDTITFVKDIFNLNAYLVE